MLHWLYLQILLTWQEIRAEVTIPHLVTGSIVYGIIHGMFNESRRVRNQAIRLHTKSGHRARFRECFEDNCASIRTQEPIRVEGQNLLPPPESEL